MTVIAHNARIDRISAPASPLMRIIHSSSFAHALAPAVCAASSAVVLIVLALGLLALFTLLSEALTQDQADEYRVDPRRRLQIANAIIQDRLHHFLFENNTLTEEEAKDDELENESLEASEAPTQSLAAIEAEAEPTKATE